MALSTASLSYRQRSILTEIIFLFVMSVMIPLAVGAQIFSYFSFTLSLVLVNCLQIPSIMLFYRVVLPYITGKRGYLYLWMLPVYLVIYELNSRLASLTIIALPFIPKEYRDNLRSVHPENFSHGYFNQTIGYTCLVLLAASSLYAIKMLQKKQHSMYQLETEKLKLELTHLRSQVQPHFFFNTLNNMYSLSVQGSPKTSAMIADLSGIMRYVLYETEHEKVMLQKEVNFIRSYIELESIRYDDPDIIDFAVQGDINGIQIEPMLFLPLVENAFKHSLHRDIAGKWVKVFLSVDEEELVFQTSNLKKPGVIPQENNNSGIGLKNVRKRLELLYPGRHQLAIHDEDESFTVTLTISLKPNK